ncbi:hypothetical protein H6P81_005313 [Aristolochia fimbriata]|uniref:Uncharacterized protein n=1 Tax=Aristolochia fimbriata TaxID=158543 RepID=A0AAV7EVI6_ARIFI|nr:hypothetical protein H6P81_005313 [Aristolochia fimbriata]
MPPRESKQPLHWSDLVGGIVSGSDDPEEEEKGGVRSFARANKTNIESSGDEYIAQPRRRPSEGEFGEWENGETTRLNISLLLSLPPSLPKLAGLIAGKASAPLTAMDGERERPKAPDRAGKRREKIRPLRAWRQPPPPPATERDRYGLNNVFFFLPFLPFLPFLLSFLPSFLPSTKNINPRLDLSLSLVLLTHVPRTGGAFWW